MFTLVGFSYLNLCGNTDDVSLLQQYHQNGEKIEKQPTTTNKFSLMMRIILMWYCIVDAAVAGCCRICWWFSWFVCWCSFNTFSSARLLFLQAGKRELFNIGTWLRKRYSNFFDSYYQPDVSTLHYT